MRKEHDFIGELEVPEDVYYGVQTMRAIDNFHITGQTIDPDFVQSIAMVKKAAALANMETGRLPGRIGMALIQAADEIIGGKLLDQFPVDPIQGGAGTSINMNMNEVLSNRALEFLGEAKGRYDLISPNNHANMAQSTNDSFPTGIKVCINRKSKKLIAALTRLADELDKKSVEFKDVLKMGRTHLQDAVPITLGQEMGSYASAVRRGIRRIEQAREGVHVINMGGTAVGTGLNAEPQYIPLVAQKLSEVTGEHYETAENLIDATNNTDAFADVSAAMKTTALVLIKMANDFRLMASGPRCGLSEVKLPKRQPGSSIMPGKVNPVIAEVLDQACYQVIANDAAVTLGVENGQFELNVMEPVISHVRRQAAHRPRSRRRALQGMARPQRRRRDGAPAAHRLREQRDARQRSLQHRQAHPPGHPRKRHPDEGAHEPYPEPESHDDAGHRGVNRIPQNLWNGSGCISSCSFFLSGSFYEYNSETLPTYLHFSDLCYNIHCVLSTESGQKEFLF